MRLLIQRVSKASCEIDGAITGKIDNGLVVFIGLHHGDSERFFSLALEKLVNLRIFPDKDGRMNRSLVDAGGGLLVISQFTLYADCRKGRRPSYTDAMTPTEAEGLFNAFYQYIQDHFTGLVQGGSFGAHMHIDLVNDGPVTISFDSEELKWGR